MMKQILSVIALIVLSGSTTNAFLPSSSRATMIVSSASSTVRFAEEKDRDYEAEIAKIEKEAMERLEAKTEEMMTKIGSTGASN